MTMWRAAILGLMAQPALAAGYPDGLPGAEAARLVTAALAAAGVSAEVKAPLRAFPACDSVPEVTPRNGDWATAEITCPAPRWSRALRTGAKAATPAPAPDAPAPLMAVTLARSLPKRLAYRALGCEAKARELLEALAQVPAGPEHDAELIARWAEIVGVRAAFHFEPHTRF